MFVLGVVEAFVSLKTCDLENWKKHLQIIMIIPK